VDLETSLSIFARVLVATLLGYAIGWEREFRGKAAGERTFALVALGAAAFTGVGIALFPESGDRVIQGVVAGIGFLGAGLIFRAEGTVHGLTTAASAWSAAAVGVLCGADALPLGVATAVLVLVILELNYVPFVRRFDARRRGEREG
jgi:putative Mg2+ transporter-C (MgtC) family protein